MTFNLNNQEDYILQAKSELNWFLAEINTNLSYLNDKKGLVLPGPIYSEHPRFSIKLLRNSIDRRLSSPDPRYSVALIDKLYSVSLECIVKYAQLIDTPVYQVRKDFEEYLFFKDGGEVPSKYIYFIEINFCVQFCKEYVEQRQLVSKIHAINPLENGEISIDAFEEREIVKQILSPALKDISEENIDRLVSHILCIKNPDIKEPNGIPSIPFSTSQTNLIRLIKELRVKLRFAGCHRVQLARLFASIPQRMDGKEVIYFNEDTIHKNI
ncbi:MAG: hypothetical protein IPH84_10455 [Bacteroidales bacterium]|nr:hypothetical protein [Bacteroidales bacterium]